MYLSILLLYALIATKLWPMLAALVMGTTPSFTHVLTLVPEWLVGITNGGSFDAATFGAHTENRARDMPVPATRHAWRNSRKAIPAPYPIVLFHSIT